MPSVEAGVEHAPVAYAREPSPVRPGQCVGSPRIEISVMELVQDFQPVRLPLSLVHIVLPVGHSAAEQRLRVLVVHEAVHPFVEPS